MFGRLVVGTPTLKRVNGAINVGKWSRTPMFYTTTLNARKSCADSFLKIKTDHNRARFSKKSK